MSQVERLREVDEALAEKPDFLAFRAIRGLVDSWPEREGRASGFRKVEAGLASWPNDNRALETSWGELDWVVDTPSWGLVRDLALDIRDSKPLPEAVRERRLESLAARAALASLTRLGVLGGDSDGTLIDAGAVVALAQSPYLQALNALRLEGVSIQRNCLAVLGDATGFRRLQEVAVSAGARASARTGPELWSPLLTRERLRGLHHLECDYLTVGDAQRLCNCAQGSLRSLAITSVSAEALGLLLECPAVVGRLERLRIATYRNEPVADRLAACPHLHDLRELDLGDTGVDAAAIATLAGAPFADRLTTLNLRG